MPPIAIVRKSIDHLLSVLIPARCISCGASVMEQGGVCGECWPRLERIHQPHCAICAQPLAPHMPDGMICATCIQTPPAYDHARSVFVYKDMLKHMVADLKYHDRTHGAKTYARWMWQLVQQEFPSVDSIVPVPLHPRRLRKRLYNQSALLAKEIAKQSSVNYAPELLIRHKHTPAQAELSQKARRRNVRYAFAVPENKAPQLNGKTILLVDDVMTTGSTLDACARALKKAGAAKIICVTLAKTIIE